MSAGPEATITAIIQRDWHRPTVNDWVDVLAPGEWVQSTYVIGREDYRGTRDRDAETISDTAVWSGTSFACGIVSGHLAAHLLVMQSLI